MEGRPTVDPGAHADESGILVNHTVGLLPQKGVLDMSMIQRTTLVFFLAALVGAVPAQAQSDLPVLVRSGTDLEGEPDRTLERYVRTALEGLGAPVLDEEPAPDADTQAWLSVDVRSFELPADEQGQTRYDVVGVASLSWVREGTIHRSQNTFIHHSHSVADLQHAGQRLAERATRFQDDILRVIKEQMEEQLRETIPE